MTCQDLVSLFLLQIHLFLFDFSLQLEFFLCKCKMASKCFRLTPFKFYSVQVEEIASIKCRGKVLLGLNRVSAIPQIDHHGGKDGILIG
jgi:uncharacterized membrane protein